MAPTLMKPKDVLNWFFEAGPSGAIFDLRPFVPGTSIFPTRQGGYGRTFELSGIDPDGAARSELEGISRDYAEAVNALPDGCVVYEYLVSRKRPPLCREKHQDPPVAQQQRQREHFLNEKAGLKDVRLYCTLYLPGDDRGKPLEYSEKKQRQLRALETGAALFRRILSRVCDAHPLSPAETTAFYSYLRGLEDQWVREEPLETEDFAQKLSPCGVKFSLDRDYMRIAERYVQMASLFQRPRGTRPAMWYDMLKVSCEFVLCSILQREDSSTVSHEIANQESTNGLSAASLGAIAMEILMPKTAAQTLPVRNASQVAQESQSQKLGGALVKLNQGETFGSYSQYVMVHSRDLREVQDALTELAGSVKVPGQALLQKEDEGSLAAYMAMFPGNLSLAKRGLPMETQRMADLAFLYKPFLGHEWSPHLRAPYTYCLETPYRAPFFYSTFPRPAAHTMFLADSGSGKSLFNIELVTSEAAHNGFLLVVDMADSYSFAIRSLGGAAAAVTPDRPRIAPFCLERSPESVSLLAGLVEGMIRTSGVPLEPGEETTIQHSVERVYKVPVSERRLGLLFYWLPDRLRAGLRNWIRGEGGNRDGKYAAMWDNVEDEFSLARRQSVDYSKVKEDRYRDLVQIHAYWTFGLYRMILDHPRYWHVPKTVVGEELWGWVDDPVLMERILRIGHSDRKNLGRLVVITPKIQGLGKFARPLRGLCPVTFFGPGNFDRELYRDFFDLNPAQLNTIQKLKAREWCIKVDGETDGYFKKVILNLDESAYARATTTPQERAERQELVEQYGYHEGMKRFEEHLRNGGAPPEASGGALSRGR